jgi:NitT/TauT family transport system substrate-binding protein
VRAFLRGVSYSLEHPEETFDICRAEIAEISDENAAVHQAVLAESMALWRTDRPGFSNPAAWQSTLDVMLGTGIVEADLSADELYSNNFLPE